jgi:hypothetical protein
MPELDDLDLLIRSAVATYADPGPGDDLARRILVRVAAKATPALTRRWLPWAIALPIAAGLGALAVLSGSMPSRPGIGKTNQASNSQPPLRAITGAAPSTTPSARTRRSKAPLQNRQPPLTKKAAQTALLPKLDVFPTPRPLTPEEKALATFAAEASEPERRSLIEAQQQADAPLAIAAIQIQPLEPPEPGGN